MDQLDFSHGLTDPELEYQCCDRLSFRNFLGYPESVPDFTPVWEIWDIEITT
ncbi:MAG: hypothetical protein B6U72_07525 [Candidatus Altiarchaeales archaeon ex4484_2]|nr:MAG: hypothetical protein B6U72_07525 [Candidatus Altiarchaeales archaeon ex4484_2]